MQHDSKEKQKSKPSPEQAAEFLRELARQMEEGKGVWLGRELNFSGAIKLEQSLKSKTDKTSLSLKLKLEAAPLIAEECAVPAPEDTQEPAEGEASAEDETTAVAEDAEGQEAPEGKKPSYKKIKKLLAEELKAVAKPAQAGQMPAMDLIEAFIRDLRLITVYPGKGDDYYPQVNGLADELAAAAQTQDLEEFKRVLAGVKELKKSCHDKFK